MGSISQWSEVANVLYIPLLIATYLGWTFRFFQKWWAVMKWPDILLLCFGLGVMSLVAVPKVLPYFEQKQAAMPTPAPSPELEALREDNTKLKTENARLRKAKVPRAVAKLPSTSASIVPMLIPAKLSAEDCDALTGAQRLWDSAERGRVEAAPGAFGSVEEGEKYRAAVNTEIQAQLNLQSIETRLCAERKIR